MRLLAQRRTASTVSRSRRRPPRATRRRQRQLRPRRDVKPAGNGLSQRRNGNAQTVLRSTLYLRGNPAGATSGRGKTTSDQLATLSFGANSAGPIALNTISVTFSGSAATGTLMTTGAVKLLDENNQPVCTTIATSSFTWSFNCGNTYQGQAVSEGATRNWTLVVNDNDLAPAATQGYVNLVATINSNANITFTDGLDTRPRPRSPSRPRC